MNKIPLIIFLCLSLQGCITTPGGSNSDIPSIVNELPKEQEQSSMGGIAAMNEFIVMMKMLKAHTE